MLRHHYLFGIALLAVACKGTPDDQREQRPVPVVATAGSAAVVRCPTDAEIGERADATFTAMTRYIEKALASVPTWHDCDAAVRSFSEFARETRAWNAISKETREWAASLEDGCRARMEEIFKRAAGSHLVESRSRALQEPMDALLERCKDKPGFKDAVRP
ncbi:MAG: hypothetical protein M3680_36310 [Myxococcota bacterium]|nr:hypothetical protein [Myxococcota bacterium]